MKQKKLKLHTQKTLSEKLAPQAPVSAATSKPVSSANGFAWA
jgi:hypothetical protein